MRVLGTETVSATPTGPERPPEVATEAAGLQLTLALPPAFGGTERSGPVGVADTVSVPNTRMARPYPCACAHRPAGVA